MTSHLRFVSRAVPLCAVAALGMLAGCQSSQTIVARVGKTAILNDEFENRATAVKAPDLQQAPNLDAGAIAIISLVREHVIRGLAEEKKIEPRDEEVERVYEYTKRNDPRVAEALRTHVQTEEDLRDSIRTRCELMALGTDGARADEKEIETAYADLKRMHPQEMQKPASATVRFLVTDDAPQAAHALNELKHGSDFKTVAINILHQGAQSVVERPLPLVTGPGRLPNTLVDTLSRLSPGQLTPDPIAIPRPTQPGQEPRPGMLYFIGEVISKDPAHEVTKDEIRPVLEQQVILSRYPDWQAHQESQIAEYTRSLVTKGELEIGIRRYANLLDTVILPMLTSQPSAAAQGAQGAQPTPGANSQGSGAPPTH